MYNEELLNSIKEQGEGLINTKHDYNIYFEEAKKEADKENRAYEYSKIRTVVFDGNDSVKFTYVDVPTVNKTDYDPLKDYTSFRYITVTLQQIKTLKFIEK